LAFFEQALVTGDFMAEFSTGPVLVSGGAGYIGSHVVYALKQAGWTPIVIDDLSNGHKFATQLAPVFHRGDIADADLVAHLCRKYKPTAAMHFAAFIEVGESVKNPAKYFGNNRDKAAAFFHTLAKEGVRNVVFSSTAAVYGETEEGVALTEDYPTRPINPYGESKLAAEKILQSIGMRTAILRYFNVAGCAPDAGIGEAHYPETHLIPRIVVPLIGAPPELQRVLGLGQGFKIYGDDHATRDGTAVRDYLHVLDLADAHLRALSYLVRGGESSIFNLGSGSGYSVKEIVQAAREVLDRPEFSPEIVPRRAGDPAMLVANSEKAQKVLGWRSLRPVSDMIQSAAAWHRGSQYQETILAKAAVFSA
jgi:UDP-glucose-4-epimerase GalE